MPIIKAGGPINNVHDLNPWPMIRGINQPINNGNPKPIRSPKLRNCFFEIISFMINRVQTPASMFHLSQTLVDHTCRGLDFEELVHPFQFS